MLRDQYDFTLRFEYYKYYPHEALLFVLTQARLKVDFAEEIGAFDPKVAADPERVEQLKRLKEEYDKAVRQHPDLMRPTKKSAKTKNPKMVPWSELEAIDLSPLLMQRWYDERAKQGGRTASPAFVERAAKRVYFYRAKAQSQSRHGTALNIAEGIEFDRLGLGNLNPVEAQLDEPNGLALMFVENAMPMLKTYCELVLGNRGICFEKELEMLADRVAAFRATLGIALEPIWEDDDAPAAAAGDAAAGQRITNAL